VADEIGKAVLRVETDASGVKTGMAEAVKSVEQFEKAAESAGRNVAKSMHQAGQATASVATASDAATKRFVASVEREIAALTLSRSEYRRWEAQVKGIASGTFEPLIAKLDEAKRAQDRFAADDVFGKKAADAAKLGQANRYFTEYANLFDQLAAAERKAASGNAFIANLEKQSLALSKTRSELLELEAAQLGVSTQAAPFIASLRNAEKGVAGYGLSAKQTQQALRLLPAQITDIVTSLASGLPIYLIAIQQGGQLKDSFGGIIPLFKTLAGLITPVGLALAALGVTAGVVGYALFNGAQELNAFNKALVFSGNAIGLTSDELGALAQSAGAGTGQVGAAAKAIAQMAASGLIAKDSVALVTRAALDLNRVAGVAVEDTVKEFVELGKSPVEAVAKLNEKYRFLTPAIYEQIRALVEARRTSEAAAVAQNAFATTGIQRAKELGDQLGSLERGWNSLTTEVKRAGAAILSIGRTESLTDQLTAAQRTLAAGGFGRIGRPDTRAEAQAEVDRLKGLIDQDKQRARSQSEAADATLKYQRAVDAVGKSQEEGLVPAEKINRALAKYRAEIELIRKATPDSPLVTPEAVARGEAGIRKDLAGPKGEKDRVPGAVLDRDISAIRENLRSQIDAYDQTFSVVEALRSADQISEAQYFEAKRVFLELDTRARVGALEAERTRLQQEKLSGADAIKNSEKIAEATIELARVRAAAGTQARVLSVQEEDALKRRKRAFDEAELSARAYLAAQGRAQQRELEAIGGGPAARDRSQAESQIDEAYESQRQQLARDRRNEDITQDEYASELDRINRFNQEALNQWRGYYDERRRLDEDWQAGASEALNTYFETARNTAKGIETALTNAFGNAEDALVKFAQTGKLSFTGLVNSFIADMLRLQVRAAATAIFKESGGASSILGFFKSFLPNANGNAFDSRGVVPFANGGVFDSPTLFKFASGGRFMNGVMGEAGPEAILPLERSSSGKLGVVASVGGGGTQIVVNNYSSARVSTRQNASGMVEMLIEEVDSAIGARIDAGRGATYSSFKSRFGVTESMGV